MTSFPSGQMTWRPNNSIEEPSLHLRLHPDEVWLSYTEFPDYRVPDPPKLGFSEGYATFLALLKQGWEVV